MRLGGARRRGYIPRMKGRLIIDLANLPEEGKAFAGELPKEIFDLPEDDAQAVGPLEYELLGAPVRLRAAADRIAVRAV